MTLRDGLEILSESVEIVREERNSFAQRCDLALERIGTVQTLAVVVDHLLENRIGHAALQLA